MYTINEDGILNNYAVEPAISYAEYPTPFEQRRYMFQGAVATLLVTLTLLTAFVASY
jgi:hypothetical protein